MLRPDKSEAISTPLPSNLAMDFFTHLLVGLLLSSGPGVLPTAVLVYGTFMGIFPDADVFLFPLWKKHPALRHHGIRRG